MSYILDALNKSEQQKERQQPPRLTSVHHKPGPTASSSWKWISVLAILGLLNAFFFWYWTQQPDESPDVSPEPVTQSPRTVEEQMTEQPVTEQPESTPRYEGELITPDTINRTPAQRPAQPVAAVSIGELPADIQRQIPDLSFSSHIYSEDPSLRVVNINGRNVREGEIVTDDLQLVEITEEGVILRYLHYTFEMSVIRDWSFD